MAIDHCTGFFAVIKFHQKKKVQNSNSLRSQAHALGQAVRQTALPMLTSQLFLQGLIAKWAYRRRGSNGKRLQARPVVATSDATMLRDGWCHSKQEIASLIEFGHSWDINDFSLGGAWQDPCAKVSVRQRSSVLRNRACCPLTRAGH